MTCNIAVLNVTYVWLESDSEYCSMLVQVVFMLTVLLRKNSDISLLVGAQLDIDFEKPSLLQG